MLNNEVRCWGPNQHGKLGYASTGMVGDDEHPAVAGTVRLQGTVTQVSLGG